MRDTSNLDRVYNWLCYLHGQNIDLEICNAPNWISQTRNPEFKKDSQLDTHERPLRISLVVLPRHEDVRGEDGLQDIIRRYWKKGGNVVMWQFNGVLYYASVNPNTGTLCLANGVGKMKRSVPKLFERIRESDEINKRKRIFTQMSKEHVENDMENDVI